MNERFERAQRYSAISQRMTEALKNLGDGAAHKITPPDKKPGQKNNIVIETGDQSELQKYLSALEEYKK